MPALHTSLDHARNSLAVMVRHNLIGRINYQSWECCLLAGQTVSRGLYPMLQIRPIRISREIGLVSMARPVEHPEYTAHFDYVRVYQLSKP